MADHPWKDRAVSRAPAGPTVTIPAADYRRLLEIVELDDTLVTCEVCGAWLDTADKATASIAEFTGCWKAATRSGSDDLCRSYRAAVLDGLPAPADTVLPGGA